ncbi:phosphatase PAP2 family protein [Micromonospora globbae]|uniref:phosphatase PAP2 family protein n=1 Tax=Micromonospora globbae TaxID=1894969 RepID=UPI003866EBBB|nr:phosphatase PAP2 family protein [Micromonospora globbae]
MGADDRGTRPHPLRELLLVAALFLAYKLGRLVAVGDLSSAYANAAHVWGLERAVRLPDEATLQGILLSHDHLVRAANRFYASVHFPATAALLLFTYLFRPALYRWARTLLAALTAVGFAIQALVPMAPPRLLSATGVLDTGKLVGPRAYGDPATDTLSNQYAAMPSLHVGWAAVVAIVLVAAGRSRWRWLWLLHPVLTLAVVVVTGNHYWLDAVAALALLGTILLLAPRPRTAPATRAATVPGTRTAIALATRARAAMTPAIRWGRAAAPGTAAVSGRATAPGRAAASGRATAPGTAFAPAPMPRTAPVVPPALTAADPAPSLAAVTRTGSPGGHPAIPGGPGWRTASRPLEPEPAVTEGA